MTFLFAPDRARSILAAMQQQWGGDLATRMAAEAARWQQDQTHATPDDPEATGGGDQPQ
jgi:penicillin-binding protein 2